MRIEECEFSDDVLYDSEGFVWARDESGIVVVGITSILAAVAGKLTSARAKPTAVVYGRGEAIGFLESVRYFGVIRTPVRGTLLAVNEAALRRPRLLSESPYGVGWFARMRPEDWRQDRGALRSATTAKESLATQVAALHVRCFAALPDYEMFEIGVECAAVLVKLNDLVAHIEVGEVVHIVSDDATAPAEMAQWTEQTGNPVVDARKEGNLFHYLVRKAHPPSDNNSLPPVPGA